jgi:ADP-ribose pyrophosphatase YjhB (NUDIX family)
MKTVMAKNDNSPSKYLRFNISCKAILLNPAKTRIVLVSYKNGNSSLPGGHLENGESLEEAVRREIKEEVGIDYTEELSQGGFIFHPNRKKLVVSFIGTFSEDIELPETHNSDDKSLGGRWHEIDQALTGETNQHMIKEYQELVSRAIGRQL